MDRASCVVFIDQPIEMAFAGCRRECPPSILVGCRPHLVGCTFTEEHGPVVIHASSDSSSAGGQDRNYTSDKPNVESMALIHVRTLAAAFETASPGWIVDTSPHEIHVFGTNSVGGSGTANANEQQKRLIETVAQMPGLSERLLDASTAVAVRKEAGLVQNFLSRCDAIVQEFLSALHQHRRRMICHKVPTGRKKRKRNEYRDDGESASCIFEYPIPYFHALTAQCRQVDQILMDMDMNRNMNMKMDMVEVKVEVEENPSRNNETKRADVTFASRIHLNDELNQITIVFQDQSNRTHELIGDIPDSFPSRAPTWVCDLPSTFEPNWIRNAKGNDVGDGRTLARSSSSDGSSSGLAAVVNEFIETISNYQTLWDDLDEIDSNAWILEPSLPARRSFMERRLSLTSSVSVHFSLDPDNSRSIPLAMRFIGPNKEIGELRSAYQAYISLLEQEEDGDRHDGAAPTHDHHDEKKSWSEDISIKENLERCFGFALPSPVTTEQTDYLVECGVCYAHRISIDNTADADDDDEDGETEETTKKTAIPDVACSNSNCGRSYHESCLSEWLHSIPGAKISFGRIFGQCPYCCDSISVKID